MQKIKCCICKQMIDENDSRNANPMKADGRCCAECDNSVVVPLRMSQLTKHDIKTINTPDIDKSISIAKIQLKRIFKNNKEAYKDMCFVIDYTYHVMVRTYIFGQIQRLKGVHKLSEQEFANSFGEKVNADLVGLLFQPYSDGYDNTEFDDTIEMTHRGGIEISLGHKAESENTRINRAMRRAKPGLKAIAGGNKDMFNDFTALALDIYKDMNRLHNDGAAYKAEGKAKLSYLDFVSLHDNLSYTGGEDNLPWKQHIEFCKMMYEAWCKGYDSAVQVV